MVLFWIGVVVVALIALYAIATYNGLVTKRNRTRNAWSQIDVQLKRRHDLVPNLVNTASAYMEHERDTLEGVTQARQRAVTVGGEITERADAENALTRAVGSLFAVAEAYPDLKANQNMLVLQEELSSTENRIAFARQGYNDAVQEYNTARESVPANLVASPLGFRSAPLFELEDPSDRTVPQVRF